MKEKNRELDIPFVNISKEIMKEASDRYLKDCKSNYICPDYENDSELELGIQEIEENIDKILVNKNLKKIEFKEIITIETLEKLSSINQVEEISFTNLDKEFDFLKDTLVSLLKFKNLKRLRIQNYYNTKYLPNEIGDLINLTYLSINLTKIEEFPESISNLKNLISLEVEMNKLKSLPNTIKNLKNLREIDISYNQLKKLPKVLLEIDNLKIENLKYQ